MRWELLKCAGTRLICSSPRCPQNGVDFRHLLRIPEEIKVQEVREDEFECLNLDVTMPSTYTNDTLSRDPLPVLVWIHGGWRYLPSSDASDHE